MFASAGDSLFSGVMNMEEQKENEKYKKSEDIFIDNWISPRLLWKGKTLVFTKHIIGELEKLNKEYEFVLEVLEKGQHRLISKRQNKYESIYPYKNRNLRLVYAEYENIILIHIKPTGKKK